MKIFWDAIMLLRSDDIKRFQWLGGTEDDKKNILWELCPYFKECT